MPDSWAMPKAQTAARPKASVRTRQPEQDIAIAFNVASGNSSLLPRYHSIPHRNLRGSAAAPPVTVVPARSDPGRRYSRSEWNSQAVRYSSRSA